MCYLLLCANLKYNKQGLLVCAWADRSNFLWTDAWEKFAFKHKVTTLREREGREYERETDRQIEKVRYRERDRQKGRGIPTEDERVCDDNANKSIRFPIFSLCVQMRVITLRPVSIKAVVLVLTTHFCSPYTLALWILQGTAAHIKDLHHHNTMPDTVCHGRTG